MRIGRLRVLWMIPILAALPACGVGGPIAQPTPTTTAQPTPTSTATGQQAQSPPPAAGKKRNIISWIADLGPSTPTGPLEGYFRAYELLQQRNCPAALEAGKALAGQLDESTSVLFTGAAQACLAAFHGRADLWPQAEAALDQTGGPTAVRCLEVPVYYLLEQLVAAHRANPDVAFEAAGVGGKTAPCPRITRLDPDHGAPGDLVTIIGENLDEVTGIHVVFNDRDNPDGHVDGWQPGGAGLQFTMPEAPQAATAGCVRIAAEPGWVTSERLFTLDRPAGPGTSPSPSGVTASPSPKMASPSPPAVSPSPNGPPPGNGTSPGAAGRSWTWDLGNDCPGY